ncbi:alpha/beta-hydrolase [Lactarius quietus]|nr:alpha/beta-hydrolase [Lactarius quietus]
MTRLILAGLLFAAFFVAEPAAARVNSARSLNKKRQEAAKRWELPARAPNSTAPSSSGVKNITFSNPKASQFYVDGSSIPDVDFDVGPSWSGLLPISAAANESRMLFFWFFPPGPEGSLDNLLFWTNGGPGCSSLEGMFQENGNQWSWTNVSSVLYVDQPVGTGFSQGVPDAQNEDDVAAQLVGFLQQFLEVFSELKGKKFYLSGESYAGAYVPYIANFIYENTTTSTLDLDLQGIWISDPMISWHVVQSEIPAVGFVHKYQHVFALNQSFLAQIDSIAEQCNYADYMEKYVTYPPQGPLPLPGQSTDYDEGCELQDPIFNAAVMLNPAFNPYRIFDMWPILWDVLGFPGAFPQNQTPVYFDRPDVIAAIHAPTDVVWTECTDVNVFPNGDASLPSSFTVLPNVIEKTKRLVIVHGLADFVLFSEGTRIALQKWGGLQGFQQPIADDSFIVDGVGALGSMHSERGLTYVEVALSGHMVPQFSPKAAFQILQYLFGLRDTP